MQHAYPSPPRSPQWVSSADAEGELVGNTRYGNREISLLLRVAEPSEGAETNLCTNPKCAVDTTGWTNSGLATMARSTLYGSGPDGVAGVGADTALHVVGNSDLDYAYDELAVTNGQSYTLSAWVYLDSNSATGVRLTIHNASGAALKANTSTFTTLDTWTRLEVTVTADATATWRFGIQQVGAGAADAYLTGVQITNASASTAYFDGDSPGCSWTGTHHGSTSTRPASGGTRFLRIQEDIEQWVDRTVREAGTLMRVTPGGEPMIFDVLDAEVNFTTGNDTIHSRRCEATLTLTCKPFWRGQWEDESSHSETTLPVAIATDVIEPGQVPALSRLLVTEAQGADQWSVVWGVRSRNYSSDASAALFYQAEDLTELGSTAVAVGAAGASGSGSNVQRNTDLTTVYSSILSTEIDATNTHLSHIGNYRVFARTYRPTGNTGAVSLALEWAEGDFRRRTRNPTVDYAADEREGVFNIVDLGHVHLSRVASGTQRWEGRIVAKSTVTGDELDIDCLWLIPLDEGAGEVSVAPRFTIPSTFSAYSGFTTESGAITGDALTTGGNWTVITNSDTDDFSVAAGVATRTAVSDSGAGSSLIAGRGVTAGTTDYTAIATQCDVKSSVLVGTVGSGVIARVVDSSNYIAAVFEHAGRLAVYQVIAGSLTLYRDTIPTGALGADTYYTIRFAIDTAGRWTASLGLQGSTSSLAELDGSSTALATGGALATGRVGLVDINSGATAATRTFDNFAAWVPTADAAVFASQSLQIREDRVIREDSGGTVWVPVTKYEGAYPRLPVTGRENRTLETIVKACRNDPYTMSDPAIDDITFQWQHAPRGITTPAPTA